MIHRLLAYYAPFIAIVAAVVAVLVGGLFAFGALGGGACVFLLFVISVGLAVQTWSLDRRYTLFEKSVRQLRFTAERFQSMVRTMPGGYCLFTPQGLLREEMNVAECLGNKKIKHFDDLVAAVHEAPLLVERFRRLQMNGESFIIQTKTVEGERSLQIAGRRFVLGKEGPSVDVLWFSDNPVVVAELEKEGKRRQEAEGGAAAARTLLDALQFPVWARGKDLNLMMCNSAYAKALDATPEAILANQEELMSMTARSGIGRGLAANALSLGEPQVERRHVIIAGRRRLLEITEMPCQGEAYALLGFAVDVTTEEEKDIELQRHMAAHREVMEHLGSGISIFGADMKLEFYNRSYRQMWDADEAFLDSHPTFSEVLENLRERRKMPEQADFQRYKKEQIAQFTSLLEPQEDLVYLPDGTSLRVLIAPHPFGGLMFVHEDVTDRLALESSYNTLMAVQRETLDNLSEGITVFGPDGKLRLSNPSFAKIWKLDQTYLASEPHITDLAEHMKPLFHYGKNWDCFKSEIVGYTLDRSTHAGRLERVDDSVVEFLTVPLPDGDVLNSYLDVSDSVRAERALRASNVALATADRLKSEFVANVSYQLRTPLNTIMGFADILSNQYFGTLNERQLDYSRTIMDASKRLLLLINDVLDLATIEAGRMELNLQKVPVADVLNAAKQLTAEWARQQALDISIDCPVDIGSFVVDEQRIRQVLFNLVSNAIKYTPSKGHITLSATRDDEWVILSVRDTGVGIPEADRERVFGKFERANPQLRQGGAGLGLSLVKSFIELHHGRVEVEPSATEGTRISCFIPVTPSQKEWSAS